MIIPNTYIKLNEKISMNIENDKFSKKDIKLIIDYIKWEYFYLKKRLNYPNQKLFIWGNFFAEYNLIKTILLNFPISF